MVVRRLCPYHSTKKSFRILHYLISDSSEIQSNFAYYATQTTVIISFLYLSRSAPFVGDDYQNKLLKLCQNFSLLSQFNLITVRNIVYIVYILISTLTTKGSPPADCSQLCHSKIPRDIYSYSVINLWTSTCPGIDGGVLPEELDGIRHYISIWWKDPQRPQWEKSLLNLWPG